MYIVKEINVEKASRKTVLLTDFYVRTIVK